MSQEEVSATLQEQPWELLSAASEYLPEVTSRKMFGCQALFAAGSIYALIWRQDRIGLKIPDKEQYAELMALPGVEAQFTGHDRNPMSHWVLLPASFYKNHELLDLWSQRAHSYALLAPKRPPRSSTKSASTRQLRVRS